MRAPTFNLADLWETLCDAGPDAECLVALPVRHTRGSLDRAANQIANHLVATGVAPGDRVGIYSRNRAEYVEALLGCWKCGAVPVNINWRYVADELSYVDRRRRARRDDRRGRIPAGARRARIRAPHPHGRLERRERGTELRRRAPLLRRRLHALHGRHHRDAQGRDVAPRGLLLRAAAWAVRSSIRSPSRPRSPGTRNRRFA